MKSKQEKNNPEKKKKSKTNLENSLKEIGLKEKKTPKPKKTTLDKEQKKIIKEITKHLEEKKCEDIVVMNLEKVNTYLSIFIVCTVASSIQAKSVVRDLERKTKHYKLGFGSTERKDHSTESGWSILDLGEIVVHVMTKETRSYYDLDKLWGDAERLKI